jgi:hypothetical protein
MWDFGSIPLNSVVAHDFPIKNVGADTLVITEVKPICGCTTAPLESDRIAPGEETNLHVQLNTKKLNGLVRKFINISCSDPVSPYLRVGLRAVINDPKQVIVPSPNLADFGNILILAMPDENIIASKLGKSILKAGETTELTFNLSHQIGAGPVVSSLTIESAGKPETRISIPITGTIVE